MRIRTPASPLFSPMESLSFHNSPLRFFYFLTTFLPFFSAGKDGPPFSDVFFSNYFLPVSPSPRLDNSTVRFFSLRSLFLLSPPMTPPLFLGRLSIRVIFFPPLFLGYVWRELDFSIHARFLFFEILAPGFRSPPFCTLVLAPPP